MEPELLQLAYAPAARYRPWQAAYAAATAPQRRWLNAALIRQRQLPLPAPGSAGALAPLAPLARRLVQLWPRLPQVATLIGAARLHDWVVTQPGAVALPVPVQAFLRSGHGRLAGVEAPTRALADDPEVLLRWGAPELCAVAPLLPGWLAARLPLPFAGLAAPHARQVVSPDLDVLWSAMTYVEKLS